MFETASNLSKEKRRHFVPNRHRWEMKWGERCLLAARVGVLLFVALLALGWGGRHWMALGFAGFALMALLLLWLTGTLLKGTISFYPATGLFVFVPLLAIGTLQMDPAVSSYFMTDALREIWQTIEAVPMIAGIADLSQSPVALLSPMTDVQTALLLTLTVAALFYILITQLFTDIKWLVLLALTVSATGAFIASVGLAQRFAGVDWFIFFFKESTRWGIEGPYFNKNHFAQLMNMAFFVSMGLLLALNQAGRQARHIREAGQRSIASYPVLIRLFGMTGARLLEVFTSLNALICFVALLLSYSRAGVLCGAAVLAVFVFYWVWTPIRHRAGLKNSTPILIVLAGVLLVSLYGLGRLTQTLDLAVSGEDPSGLVRLEIWKTALAVISLSPLVGTGFAGIRTWGSTFGESYTPGKIAFDAHNDYLDLVIAVGWPVAILILAFLAFLLVRALLRVTNSKVRNSSLHWIVIGVLAGILAAAGHEVFDYGLKQTANLCVFLVLCVLAYRLTVLSLEVNPETNGNGNGNGKNGRDMPATKWILGRPLYGVLAVAAIATLFGVNTFSLAVSAGATVERLNVLIKSPEVKRAMDASAYLERLVDEAWRVSPRSYAKRQALETEVNAWRALSEINQKKALAASVSRMLDREVSVDQVQRSVYARFWPEAFLTLSQEDRARVAKDHREAGQKAFRLWTLNPVNALALSVMASEFDEAAAWEQVNTTAVAAHLSAMALYPYHRDVLARTISGLWRAWQIEKDSTKQSEIFTTMQVAVKRIAEQSPRDLAWIYPQVWMIDPSVARIESLTPMTIVAQEKLAQFLTQVGANDEALKAWTAVAQLNSVRPKEETPETLGNIGYLRREKRDRLILERQVYQAQVPLLMALSKTEEAEAKQVTVEAMLFEERTKVITRADALMERGDYVLAEEVLKPVREDVRGLVRWAEILLNGGRFEQYRRVMQEIENQRETLDEETRQRFEKLEGRGKR